MHGPVITLPTCLHRCNRYDHLRWLNVLLAGRECWIDNNVLRSITRHGKLPESQCHTPCGGDNSTTCGGTNAFKLYELV